MTNSHNGSYSIELRNLSTGSLLLDYDNQNIDLWRVGAEFVRPKWGIYRSLKSKEYLRDEQVRFDRFCLAKGSGVKGGEKVYHCGGGIVYHRHDEKGLNWEPGGIRSGAGVRSSGVSQESTGSSDTWEAALCRLCLRR